MMISDQAAFALARVYDQAWTVATFILGGQITGIGLGFWISGSDGLTSTGKIFEASTFAPWWFWASWATISGLLILFPRPERSVSTLSGLLLGSGWLGTWGVILFIAVLQGRTAIYIPFLYFGLVSMWILFAVVEQTTRGMLMNVFSGGGDA